MFSDLTDSMEFTFTNRSLLFQLTTNLINAAISSEWRQDIQYQQSDVIFRFLAYKLLDILRNGLGQMFHPPFVLFLYHLLKPGKGIFLIFRIPCLHQTVSIQYQLVFREQKNLVVYKPGLIEIPQLTDGKTAVVKFLDGTVRADPQWDGVQSAGGI